MIAKLIISVVAVLLIVWVGAVIFFINPLNWKTNMYWLNWPLILSNGAILAFVVVGCWLALRRIWRPSIKKSHPPPEPTHS